MIISQPGPLRLFTTCYLAGGKGLQATSVVTFALNNLGGQGWGVGLVSSHPKHQILCEPKATDFSLTPGPSLLGKGIVLQKFPDDSPTSSLDEALSLSHFRKGKNLPENTLPNSLLPCLEDGGNAPTHQIPATGNLWIVLRCRLSRG